LKIDLRSKLLTLGRFQASLICSRLIATLKIIFGYNDINLERPETQEVTDPTPAPPLEGAGI
ncbi:MAG: hypothetical protein J5548_08370, partial [Prevotella sp.]|nr:hypothetical protein [Prevotella sp.]